MLIKLDDDEFWEAIDDHNDDPLGVFELTELEVDEFTDPVWAYKNFIIEGHMMVVPAAPNAGKTTLLMQLAGELVRSGYEVVYVNVDVSASDAKSMYRQAKTPGAQFRLLTPDLKVNQSAEDLTRYLKSSLANNTDFSKQIWIFDTLKKFTDVINKSAAKNFYKLLRALTGKGMTIIALAHTNKYPGPDGKPIFEGTGDLRADFDELIYLVSQEDSLGGRKISTVPDKVRGKFEPISFYIDSERRVSLMEEYQDIAAQASEGRQRAKDEFVIDSIYEALADKRPKQSEIVAHCKSQGISQRQATNVLKRYTGKLWKKENGYQNNVKIYSVI